MRYIVKPGDKEQKCGFILRDAEFERRKKKFRKAVNITTVDEFIQHIQFKDYIPYIEAIITEDGSPVSVAGVPAYYLDDALLTDLPKRQRKLVLDWIEDNFYIRKTPNHNYHTYRLKHILQYDTGIYLTDNQFKDAMLQCGFFPLDRYDGSWYFCLGLKDPRRLEKVYGQGRFIQKNV